MVVGTTIKTTDSFHLNSHSNNYLVNTTYKYLTAKAKAVQTTCNKQVVFLYTKRTIKSDTLIFDYEYYITLAHFSAIRQQLTFRKLLLPSTLLWVNAKLYKKTYQFLREVFYFFSPNILFQYLHRTYKYCLS